jgi:hypothetical protein
MRPVRTIIAVIFAAAVAVAGCSAHTTADQPTVAPTPQLPVEPTPPVLLPPPPGQPPHPVLADGRYPSYIRTVDRHRNQLVVDLVQVFDGQAARDAAIADGLPNDQAQVLGVWVRNQNPRLQTLPLARDLRLDLRGGDCEAPRNHQLTKLAADARSMSGPIHTSSLHPDRARWRRPPGPGVPGHQRLLSRPTGSLAPPCDAGHRLALPLCQDLAVIEGW